MVDLKKPTREKRRSVTLSINYKQEFYENWGSTEELTIDEVLSDLGLSDIAGLGAFDLKLGAVEIKCDECCEWKDPTEFDDTTTSAAQGQDFCKDCEQARADEDVKNNGYDPQGGDGDDD